MINAKTMDDTEIRFKGIEVLNKDMGATAAMRFLALISHEPTNYVKISKCLYDNQSIDEIYIRAKKYWKNSLKFLKKRKTI